jgi:hypothetical protein
VGLRGGSLGEHSPGGTKEQDRRIDGRSHAYGAAVPWAYAAGLGVQRLLFFQCMVAWRGLSGARGSQC